MQNNTKKEETKKPEKAEPQTQIKHTVPSHFAAEIKRKWTMQHPDPKECHTPIVHYDGLTRHDRIKGKAKIMPFELQPFTHLKKHVLNELIGRVNEGIHVLLKK